MSKNEAQNFLEEFAKLSDNSFRDGNQSLDKNRIKIENILPAMPAYNGLYKEVKNKTAELGLQIEFSANEFWGGGQVGQPFEFLKENALDNLARIYHATPDVGIKALFRGRQAYGFSPVAEDVQRAAIKRSFELGVEELRIFDMVNDDKNLEAADRIATEEKNNFEGKKIIKAIAYTRPTKAGEIFQTPQELANKAVQRAKDGADIIEIKDYAGNLFSAAEAKKWASKEGWPEDTWKNVSAAHITSTIRKALDAAGFNNTKLHFHSHGQKPEALSEALDAGANVVDVGIGMLSAHYTDRFNGKETEVTNTLAFTNLRDMLEYRMKEKHGININNSDNPTIKAVLEKLKLAEVSISYAIGDVNIERREQLSLLNQLPSEMVRYHPMAGGAISAMKGLIDKHWDKYNIANGEKLGLKQSTLDKLKSENYIGQHVKTPQDFTKGDHFLMAVIVSEKLWEMAGAYPTVTPGAKILAEQAGSLTCTQMLQGKSLEKTTFSQDFEDVFLGRYGVNSGLEKGFGDQTRYKELVNKDVEKGGRGVAHFTSDDEITMKQSYKFVDDLAAKKNFTFGKGCMPSRDDAALIAALTFKGGKNSIVEPLFDKLKTLKPKTEISGRFSIQNLISEQKLFAESFLGKHHI